MPMSVTERLLVNADSYAGAFVEGDPPEPASTHVAIVACMDARLDLYRIFGLRRGEAHVIRNAGGIITDDAIRSLSISQRNLGTREVMLVHHTDCRMMTFTDEAFAEQVERDTGVRPPWAAGTFTDLDEDVRKSMTRVRESPFVLATDAVRGFVYDVHTGQLTEVHADS
jgi:carbonic anhydrase